MTTTPRPRFWIGTTEVTLGKFLALQPRLAAITKQRRAQVATGLDPQGKPITTIERENFSASIASFVRSVENLLAGRFISEERADELHHMSGGLVPFRLPPPPPATVPLQSLPPLPATPSASNVDELVRRVTAQLRAEPASASGVDLDAIIQQAANAAADKAVALALATSKALAPTDLVLEHDPQTGRPSKMHGANGTTNFQYDSLGRLSGLHRSGSN